MGRFEHRSFLRLNAIIGHVSTPVPSLSSCCVAGVSTDFSSILVANRGEIALRICRAAADLGLRTVAIFSQDDAKSLHAHYADEAHPLSDSGVGAYLDIEGIIGAAKKTKCEAIHPGYGFLSENADFASRCREEGITFIGPSVEMLQLFGDKGRARRAALAAGVPVMAGIDRAVTLDEVRAFFAQLGHGRSMMIKAIAGAGGRGSRIVTAFEQIDEAYEQCRAEAMLAFGSNELYVEELLETARHIEVQVLADLNGNIIDLGERECSVQRRHQKMIEIAPAPHLHAGVRREVIDAALRLARSVGYTNIGTFEFLVGEQCAKGFAFIEANARLQVEHTVTEEVTGVDICSSQIRIARGVSLKGLGLNRSNGIVPQGIAIQTRVNMETLQIDGTVRPSGGMLTVYDPPGGPGVRVDGFGYTGYETSPSFDSLLAKVIVHTQGDDLHLAAARTSRALSEFRIEGVTTNIPFLQNVLRHNAFLTGEIHTRFVDDHAGELASALVQQPRNRFSGAEVKSVTDAVARENGFAGVQVDSSDPLALFGHGKSAGRRAPVAVTPVGKAASPPGTAAILSPIQGTLRSLEVNEGDSVKRGQRVAVVEAMKMEHDIIADKSGSIRKVTMALGDTVREGYPLFFVEESGSQAGADEINEEIDLDFIRPDLAELRERHSYQLDGNRPDAVARRRKTGQRTARENIDDLCDIGTFVEYGPLAVAWQRRRRSKQWLQENSPADGLVCGLATVNCHLFDASRARVIVMSYDYTVFAGTQGSGNHYKKDRIFHLAERFRLPVVIFTEGGGGRPGDTEGQYSLGMDTPTFTTFSKLSALVPLVGITSGRCFAGNTALLACCDVIIATADSTVAMGGPAMIEGGGLGVYAAEEVGPLSFQVPNGTVDIMVEDEAEAVTIAKRYLAYFQGPTKNWTASDQRKLRHIVPESRKRTYDMRELIHILCDTDSVLEIRPSFGVGILTCLVRIEGVPLGLIANNPHHLAGAIDSPASDKAARFLQLCDAFDLPIISLMDCPGMMVGPDVERTALVRHCARLFNTGANLSVPLFGLVIRKAYGLGVQAMCGGSSQVPFFTAAWPTGEFAGMGIEGAVKLGYRNELAAKTDPEERLRLYEKMVEHSYNHAKAVNSAQGYGIDDVIDPADSRKWIVAGVRSLPPEKQVGRWASRQEKKRPCIDTW